MLYEYALISVVIASGYWGWYFLKNPPNGTPLFGIMQVLAALLSGLGLLGRHVEAPALGIAGAIGLGGGLCLLVVGPLVRGVARRFASIERIGVASRLLDVAEVLAPGSGVAEEKALLGAMKEIREGRVEQTVDALVAAKQRAPAEAKLAIDERIAMLYLAAYRWQDAIQYAEAHLMPATEPAADGGTPPISLRDALGIAPPVWVELLGAYGRTGDLDRAARMLARLEDACAGREDANVWLHRARLMFLALAGRPEAVRALVEAKRAPHMSRAARTYWLAVAHEHHGDREAAAAAYERARGKSRGRPRELIDEALARVPSASAVELSPETSTVVARVEAAPLPPPIKLARIHGPRATYALTASLFAVAIVVATMIGPTSDVGVLVRAGAMARTRVADGEWWRLVTCIFLHVGTVHLAVNAIGLFFLGRICEELFGAARTIAIFAVAGLAGSLASYLGSTGGVSAGASGAIFGVLGAIFTELTVHRGRYRAAWKRGMWGALAVVTVAQVATGFFYPMIDQWAHGAGLVAGMAISVVLSPSIRIARITRHVGRAIAIGFTALAIVSGGIAARTSLADSLLTQPRQPFALRQFVVVAPASAQLVPLGDERQELQDPDGLYSLELVTASAASDIGERIDRLVAKDRGVATIERAPDQLVALPPGWQGSEQIATIEDAMGYAQRYRVIACGKVFGDTLVLVVVYAPESIVQAVPELVGDLIASIAPS
ncbi:MAG TPA: rhomboid family intramembrane serine protease [Kofleriaceae bacterium]|nr:rhomboid family intramembrane serine protease [Kofleriaceae bacterium]